MWPIIFVSHFGGKRIRHLSYINILIRAGNNNNNNNKQMDASQSTFARALLQEPSEALVSTVPPRLTFPCLLFLFVYILLFFVSDLSKICSVCTEVFKDPIHVLLCCHCFCHKCIEQWAQKNISCPLCAEDVSTSSTSFICLECIYPFHLISFQLIPSHPSFYLISSHYIY